VTKLSSVIKLAWALESCGAILMLLAASVNATAAAATSNDDMARCAAIQAPDTRLSCYDTLAHRPPDKVSPAVVKAAPVPAATAVQPPATVAAIAADPQNFGLTAVQQHTADLGPKSERAHISIVSSDQSGRTFVVLDSGQTWTVMDSDGRLNSGDAVTIKRAALGSFLMLTPSNHSYRVRRVK
jgi:hypothetical protein